MVREELSSKSISIVEVGPRDGFQNVRKEIPTGDKVKIIDLLSAAGLRSIEATSFTHPKWIPQLKDAAEVIRRITKPPGVVFSALIPNEKGLDRAIENGLEEVVFVVSASEALNRENFNKSTWESLAELSSIAEKARRNGVQLRGAIAASFGCPFEGSVSVERVIEVAEAFRNAGVSAVTLADTTGMAHPLQVKELLSVLLSQLSDLPIALHFHDTRRIGLVNVYSAWQAGAKIFESSIAGLGGCPYAPGAPGNVATESLVYMFHKMGVETGVNLDRLVECSQITQELVSDRRPDQGQG
ncbi:MAG: hydroxymethylglutaryl-CoA lyase [Deltaproteobacteria bacterium]|nr:hydroxymethylglutaryl-CoA lyase [Deltaproteobacteria bacterium]